MYNLFQFSFLLFGWGHLCNRKGDLYLKKNNSKSSYLGRWRTAEPRDRGDTAIVWVDSKVYNLFQLIFYLLGWWRRFIGKWTYIKKIRPPNANTWPGEDGRAKGWGWLHTSQWLRKEILVYNLFHFSFYWLAEDACATGRGTYILKKLTPKAATWVGGGRRSQGIGEIQL